MLIRAADPKDALSVARVHVRAWAPEGVRRSGIRAGIEVQEQRFRRAL